jgi:thiol reductant ABC exporter CydD subunit
MFSLNLWKAARKQLFPLTLSIILSGGIGALIVCQAWLLSKVISGVFLDGWGITEIQTDLFQLTIVIILRSALVYWREIYSGRVSTRVRLDMRQRLFSHLLELSPVQVQGESTGEIVNTLVQGIDRLDPYFRVYLPQLSIAVLVPVIILLIVFPLDWLTGTIFVLTAPLIPLFMILIGKEAESRTNRQWQLLGRLSSHFLEVLQGLRTLKAFGLSRRQGKVIRTVSEEYARITMGVLKIAFLSALVLELLATISTAIVAVQIGLRLLNGQITFFDSLFVLILAPEYYFPLRQLGAAFHSGMEGIAASERIFNFMATKTAIPRSRKQVLPVLTSGKEILFEQVFFDYQEGKRPALKGFDLIIPFFEHTTMVGKSGSGKSTVFALLMGFIKADRGTIMIGDFPISEIDMECWRAQISWVPQFPYLFQGSIRDNLLVAKPDARHRDVVEAIRQAHLDEFIAELPEGINTTIGERGVRLSGGQSQRIAIARAFLRRAPILLLDEPATSLDVDDLEAIHQAIDTLKQDRTVVTISHQLSRVRAADHVVVIDNGIVHQSGTHEEMAKAGGLYSELIHAGRRPL